ncbi:MAG: hypothetical protein ACSHYA_12445 [Opitutaceae bacterium]
MGKLEAIIVALIVIAALLYLYKCFKPKSDKGAGCGCGTVDCKVPKPKLEKTQLNR